MISQKAGETLTLPSNHPDFVTHFPWVRGNLCPYILVRIECGEAGGGGWDRLGEVLGVMCLADLMQK